MLIRKFKHILFFALVLAMQSCVTNNVLTFENDDVYFIKKDIVSEDEMQEYLDNLNTEEEIKEDNEVEEIGEYED